MRICYVASDVVVPHFRGAATHVYELSSHLASLGHELHLVTRRIGRNQPSKEIVGNIHLYRYFPAIFFSPPVSTYGLRLEDSSAPFKGIIRSVYASYLFTLQAAYIGTRAAEIVERAGIDVIIERETSFGAGAVASLLTGRPLVLEMIGPRYNPLSLHVCKKVFVYSMAMLNGKVPMERVVLVNAATNTELFRPDSKLATEIRSLHRMGDGPIVGYLGSFAAWHGVEDLIHAAPLILEKNPQTKFLMVGPYFSGAKRLVEQLALTHAFVFSGAVPYNRVPAYMNAADILVAPYNPDRVSVRRRYGIGSPLKLFEYLATGKPVVASSLEIIRQVIVNGETGLLARPGDPNDIAQKVIRLLEEPNAAERMGRKGRELVERKYSWARFVSQLQAVLTDVLNYHAGPQDVPSLRIVSRGAG